jgi:hypothetical protein
MNRSRLGSLPEVWTGVASDVGVDWRDIKADDVTANFLAAKTLGQLKGQRLSLDAVRDLGTVLRFFVHQRLLGDSLHFLAVVGLR